MAEQVVALAPGESKQVSFEAIPNVAKTYQVAVDGLSGSFIAVEVPVLILTAKNMPDYVWDGQIKDLASGRRQGWPVQHISERVILDPPAGNRILFQYQMLYAQKGAGPFLIELPSTTGDYIWDGSTKKLSGVNAIELPLTNNKQRIKGTLTRQEYSAASTPPYYAYIRVTESVSYSGKVNVGQYFVGEEIIIPVNPTPLASDRANLALSVGDLVECDCVLQYGWPVPYLAAFIATFLRRQRQYPDSAYVFQASGNIIYGTWNLKLTVSGAVSPFSIVVIGYGVGESYPGSGFITEYYYHPATILQGPLYNAVVPLGMAWTGWKVLAHPDPAAEFRSNYWRTDNWQQVLEILP